MLAAFSQEGEEFKAFTQSPLEHIGAARHLTDERCDLGRTEIKAPVKFVNRVENLRVTEMRIV
jgi:hypothetical protein